MIWHLSGLWLLVPWMTFADSFGVTKGTCLVANQTGTFCHLPQYLVIMVDDDGQTRVVSQNMI